MPGPSIQKAYGLTSPTISVFPFPIYKSTSPTTNDRTYLPGQVWVHAAGDTRTVYIFGGRDSSGLGVWTLSSTSAGDLNTLQGDTGGEISATLGNIFIVGSSNITTDGDPGTSTIAVDLASDITVTSATAGNLKVYVNRIEAQNTNGNVILYPNGTGTVNIQGQTANTVATYGASGAMQGVGPLTNGQLLIGSTGAQPVAANLTSTGGSVTITNTAGGINLEAAGGGSSFTWSVVTASTASIAANTGIITDNATSVAVTLPATAAVGDMFRVVAKGGSGASFVLGVSTGQSIRFGNTFTTTSSGTLSATQLGDAVEVVCSVANTAFIVTSVVGNLTVT